MLLGIQTDTKGYTMELILISKSKLKIMLNESDMKEYSIGKDTDCVDPSARKAIRSILERAKEQVGFNTEGDEIFVQLYTSKKGGCELFITKTMDSDSGELDEKAISSAKKLLCSINNALPASTLGDTSKSPMPTRKSSLTFSFDTLANLLKVCKIILLDEKIDKNLKSRAMTDGESYFLTLANVGISAFSRLDRFTFITEFGTREDTERIDSYISEYGRVICRNNAIETLGALY